MKYCVVDGCENKHVAKGFCRLHYDRMKATGTTDDPRPELTERECTDCKLVKPVSEFHGKGLSPKGRRMYQSYCRPCANARRVARAKRDPEYVAKSLKYNRTYQEKNREMLAKKQAAKRAADPIQFALEGYQRHLKKKFGITWEEYLSMMDAQNFHCAICDEEFEDILTTTKRPHVDHDHETGEVRGVLCGKCNTGIGMLNDSVDRVESALNYLKKYAKV